jgi:hypothetical protein
MYWVSARCGRTRRRGLPRRWLAGELLDHQHGAFAAAEGDGVGDFGARVVDGGGYASYRLIADEVADVGNDPGRRFR